MVKKLTLKGKYLAWPFVWLTNKIPGLKGSQNAKIFLKEGTGQGIGTYAIAAPFGLIKEPFIQFVAKFGTGLAISILGSVLHSKKRKKIINKDFRDELMSMGMAVMTAPGKGGFGSYADEVAILKVSAQRVLNKINLGAYSFADVGIVIAKLRNALKLGFSKLGFDLQGVFDFLNKKKWFKSVPTTHSPAKSGRYSTNLAEDFGYTDTKGWFQDVSKFSPSFVGKRRFRISGVNQG